MKKNKFEILKFINSHKNWKEILMSDPYNLLIREFDGYILIKYNQIFSDFSQRMVREARGFILKKENNRYRIVCAPFTKFFCIGDPNANKDLYKLYHRKKWLVEEKIDGSLIKLWFDDGQWHISTNGTIDAKDAEVQFKVDGVNNFKELFDSVAQNKIEYDKLDKLYTYMFELVGTANKVIVPYSISDIYYLGRRNNYTLEEVSYFDDDCRGVSMCKRPKCKVVNVLNNPKKHMNAICNDAKSLSQDSIHFEGYVVSDLSLKTRIKIKSDKYMELFRQKGNGIFTTRKILLMILDHKDDDMISSFPEYKMQFDTVKNKLIKWVERIKSDLSYMKDNFWETKKDFALWANSTTCPFVMFAAYNCSEITSEWLENRIRDINIDKLTEYIEK